MSFIETSALDASNVEAAFQNILSGELRPPSSIQESKQYADEDILGPADIYHIVAKKNLETSADEIQPTKGEAIDIARSQDDGGAKQGGKCC